MIRPWQFSSKHDGLHLNKIPIRLEVILLVKIIVSWMDQSVSQSYWEISCHLLTLIYPQKISKITFKEIDMLKVNNCAGGRCQNALGHQKVWCFPWLCWIYLGTRRRILIISSIVSLRVCLSVLNRQYMHVSFPTGKCSGLFFIINLYESWALPRATVLFGSVIYL